MRHVIVGTLIAFLMSGPQHTDAAARTMEPDAVVTAFHASLLETLGKLTGHPDQARYDALQEIMDNAFNYDVMVKTVAGRQWRKAEPDIRKDLRRAFREVSIAAYADQYAGLTDGRFETLGSRDGPRGLRLVDTRLITPSRNIGLTYVLREKNGEWRIIDILLDDGKISELARKASEYAKPLKQGGIQGLIYVLKNRKRALLAN